MHNDSRMLNLQRPHQFKFGWPAFCRKDSCSWRAHTQNFGENLLGKNTVVLPVCDCYVNTQLSVLTRRKK